MKKYLATFGVGPASAALEVSLPRIAEYAFRHGYKLVVPGPDEVRELCHGRPPSWGKIPLMMRLAMNSTASAVVWLDADVIPTRMDKDIADDASPNCLNVVVQNTPDGAVPSFGVIVATQGSGMIKTLFRIARAAGPDGMGLQRSHGWWEQAAAIKALGGDPDQTPIVTPPRGPDWSELPYEWNPHPCDPRGIPDDCRFFHATATNDRVGDMKRWVQMLKEKGL